MFRRSILVVIGLGASAVGIAALALQDREISEPDGPLHVDERQFEVPELAEAGTVAAALRMTREIVEGGSPQDALGQYDGRLVFACAYGIERRAVCGKGEGRTLGASVRAAATDLAARATDFDDARVKLDFVVDRERVRWPARGFDHHIGVYGLLVRQGGEETWLTPSELLEIPVWRTASDDEEPTLEEPRLLAALQERNPAIGELAPDFAFERIRTISWIERPDGTPLRLYRAHAFDPPELSPDLLLERAFLAADHLAMLVGTDGTIRYLYDPSTDRELDGYNRLRHAGSTWSLIQAWSRFRHAPWLEAAEEAIGYLLENSVVQERHGPFGGGETRWVRETSRIKLGGAGLALLALAEYQAATGDDRYLDEARQFGRYIVSAQQPSGEFVYFGNIDPQGPPIDKTSGYYPGEAILGLMRLYSIDPDPLWFDTARRGADWLIRVRDAGKGPSKLANDHWLMMGLARLYAETKDPRWLAHSMRLAEAVQLQARRPKEHHAFHHDYRGGFYQPPRSTPAATRSEGLVAVLDTCRLAGTECEDVRQVLEDAVRHQLQTQYTPELMWWMPSPERAVGAFYGGIVDLTIRNDFVQHNLSAVLGLERIMRMERGEEVPGAPDQTASAQRAFPGVARDRLEALQRELVAIRGETRWEIAARQEEREQAAAEPEGRAAKAP